MIKIFCLIIMALVIFTISCEGPVGPQGPSGKLTGTVIGFVELYDQYSGIILDKSGVEVTIEGSYHSATTNNDGRWSIENLETGTYTFVFSKSGFGLNKLICIGFVGGGEIILNSTISQIPTYTVSNVTTVVDDYFHEIVISGDVSPVIDEYRGVRIYIGLTDAVSSDPADYLLSVRGRALRGELNFEVYLSSILLNQWGISTGQKAYIIVYPASYNQGGYIDIQTGRYFYTALGSPSSVVSVTVP